MMEKTVDTHSPKTAISVRFCQKRFASLFFTSCGEQVCSEVSSYNDNANVKLNVNCCSIKSQAVFSADPGRTNKR